MSPRDIVQCCLPDHTFSCFGTVLASGLWWTDKQREWHWGQSCW